MSGSAGRAGPAGSGPLPLAPSAAGYLGAVLPRGRRPDVLPDRVVAVDGVRADRAHLDAWSRVCAGGPEGRVHDLLPAAYLHVLTFGAQLRLLTDPAMPFPALGLVHVTQRLVTRRPVRPGEVLDLAVVARDLRPHRRGRQLDLVATVHVAGEPVWEGTSTYLHRGAGGSGAGGPGSGSGSGPGAGGAAAGGPGAGGAAAGGSGAGGSGAGGSGAGGSAAGGSAAGGSGAGGSGGSRAAGAGDSPAPEVGVVRWSVPASTGRAYAAVAGDRNPIHTSAVGARLLGFRRPIAHGMWTLARTMADLEGRVPPSSSVTARFLRPLSLPGRARLGWVDRDGGLDVAVRRERDGEPHLLAEVRPL